MNNGNPMRTLAIWHAFACGRWEPETVRVACDGDDSIALSVLCTHLGPAYASASLAAISSERLDRFRGSDV